MNYSSLLRAGSHKKRIMCYEGVHSSYEQRLEQLRRERRVTYFVSQQCFLQATALLSATLVQPA